MIEDEAWIKVKDTGIGMSQEEQDRVFEKFYRSAEARRLEARGLEWDESPTGWQSPSTASSRWKARPVRAAPSALCLPLAKSEMSITSEVKGSK